MSYIPTIGTARLQNDAVTGAKVLDGTLTDADVAAANKDGSAGVASMRTIGTGALQAMAGSTRLDTIAAPTGSVSLNSQKIINLLDPTADQDAATKSYVDTVAAGLDPKQAVLYTTTGAITLSGLATQGTGTWPAALTAGARILVKNQASAVNNGIYTAAAGTWTRASDFDGTPASEVTNGAFTLVAAADGTSLVGSGWVLTTADPITVGTSALNWVQFSAASSITTLDSLTDVDVTGAVSTATLVFDGTNWVDSVNVLIDDTNKKLILGSGTNIQQSGVNMVLTTAGNVNVANNFFASSDGTISGKSSLLGGMRVGQQSFAADRTVNLSTDYVLVMDSTAAARTVTLPSSHNPGSTIIVKRTGANNVIVATNDTDKIDGSTSDYTLDVDLMASTFVSDGTDWWVI